MRVSNFVVALGLLWSSAAFADPPPVTTYTYDSLGRIATVTYGTAMQITYTYDAAGNRTQVVTQPPPP